MPDAATGPDGRWLGAARVSLTAGDVADALAVAVGARLRLPQEWGLAPRSAVLAVLAAGAGLAFWLLPPDVAAGIASLCTMAAIVGFGRVPHRLLVVVMAPAAWMTVRQNAALMDAFVAWGRTGLHAAGQGTAAITLWSEIDGWGEGQTLVLRKPGAGYIIVPKRCLTLSQADEIRALLHAAGVPSFGQADLRAGVAQDGAGSATLAPPGRRRVTVRLTLDETVAARRFFILRGVLTRTTLAIAILVAFAAWWAGWTVVPGDRVGTAIRTAAVGLAYVIGVRLALPLLLTRWQLGRRMRVRRDAGADVQVEWDADGFTCVYADGDVCKRWTEVRRWHLAKGFVFLSLGPNFGQTIPRRALDPAQLADLQACAAASGVKGAGV